MSFSETSTKTDTFTGQGTWTSTGNGLTTVNAGDTLVAVVIYALSNNPSGHVVSDPVNGNWTIKIQQNQSFDAGYGVYIAVFENSQAATNLIVSQTSGGFSGNWGVFLVAIGGAGAYDVSASSESGGSSQSSWTTGSVTTTAADYCLGGALTTVGTGTDTLGPGGSETTKATWSTTVSSGLATVEQLTQGGAGSQALTWASNPARRNATAFVAIKPGGAARALFRATNPLTGLGVGGSFFTNPIG